MARAIHPGTRLSPYIWAWRPVLRICGYPQRHLVTSAIVAQGAPSESAGRLAFLETGFWRILAIEMLEPKREELKMVGRTRNKAINNTAKSGFLAKASRRNWISGIVFGEKSIGFKRIRALALLAILTVGCTGLPILARGKGNAPTPVAPGLSPEMVNHAEQRLAEIGYWTGPIAGIGSERTRIAVLAFQRVEGRSQTGKLDSGDIQALASAARPTPRETGYAHIEADLSRQVLFLVDQNGAVTLVLPISSGSGKLYTFEGKTSRAVTPRGRFTVYRKVKGWRKAPLGMIYYPNYFNEGWAIHGSASVPNYPASHGCIRIPNATAKELFDLIPVGTVVLVYDSNQAAAISPRG